MRRMPIYEFQCKKCGHVTELIQKLDDPAPATCPKCKAKRSMTKMMSSTAFVFKGEGWYITDYSRKDKEKKEKSKAKPKADAGESKKAKE